MEAAPARTRPNQRTVRKTLLRTRNPTTAVIKTTSQKRGTGSQSCASFPRWQEETHILVNKGRNGLESNMETISAREIDRYIFDKITYW